MATDVEFARTIIADARGKLAANVAGLTLEDGLYAAGGYRSILGVLKHIGGWAWVYRSYAFDREPRHWEETEWPRGLRETVEVSQEYFDEVVRWADDGLRAWATSLAAIPAYGMSEERPLHWGGTAPLSTIVMLNAHHVVYHTGELNMLLSLKKGEAWEYTEEVEENHISTFGHGVRPGWMPGHEVLAHEERMRTMHERRTFS